MLNSKTVGAFIFAALAMSCSSAGRPQSISHEQIMASNLETANQLCKRGRFLEASTFYEAALEAGAHEPQILPKLIIAQVRSGRLRAARQSVTRLAAIDPSGNLQILEHLLNKMTMKGEKQ